MRTPSIRRSDVDACPGALRLHTAADGPLARVRLPGGLVTGAQIAALGDIAQRWGDGHVELTSRANVQLRGLTDAPPAELAARLREAGLLPSATHELVRNILASPLSAPAVRALVAQLDRALCADPELAALPGRFLFALDDGSGDVARAADVAAVPMGGEVAILFAGTDAGLRVPPGEVVPALLAGAHAFLAARSAQPAARGDEQQSERPAWRVRELDDGPARVAARTAALLARRLGAVAPVPGPPGHEPVGIVGRAGGPASVAALVPFGRLGAGPMRVLEAAALLVAAPWRAVVVPDLSPAEAESWLRRLTGAGLEVTAGSRWSGVTACAGRPGCASALADVRRDAADAVAAGPVPPGTPLLPVHWVGCPRGCGSPGGAHVRVEATGDGYTVTGPDGGGHASVAEVGAMVAAARRS